MATNPQVRKALIERAGIHPPTATYALRYCAEAGLTPKGERGGGRKQPHLEVPDLANLLIALLARDPLNDVGRLVPIYRDLVVVGESTTEPVSGHLGGLGGPTVQQTSFQSYIGGLLNVRPEGAPTVTFGAMIERLIAGADKVSDSVRVSAKRNDLSAAVADYDFKTGRSRMHMFAPVERRPSSAVSPWIGVEGSAGIEMFRLLGELAQDTFRKTGTPLFEMATNSTKPGTATPKTETGPTSSKGGPASLLEPLGDSFDRAASPSLDKRKGSAARERKQSPESRPHGSKPPLLPLRGSKSHDRQHQHRPSSA